jgi:hypothetical protein
VVVEAIRERGLYKVVGIARTLITNCSIELKKSNLNNVKDLDVIMQGLTTMVRNNLVEGMGLNKDHVT